jgi:hypothetical protein
MDIPSSSLLPLLTDLAVFDYIAAGQRSSHRVGDYPTAPHRHGIAERADHEAHLAGRSSHGRPQSTNCMQCNRPELTYASREIESRTLTRKPH